MKKAQKKTIFSYLSKSFIALTLFTGVSCSNESIEGVDTTTLSSSNEFKLEDGTNYHIQVFGGGKYLTIENDSRSNGANLEQQSFGRNNTKSQLFRLGGTGDSFNGFTIKNLNSNRFLDVTAKGKDRGDNVQQWAGGGSSNTNQHWALEESSKCSTCFKVKNRNSGMYLDVERESTSNGGNLHQWTSTNGNNQVFKFIVD